MPSYKAPVRDMRFILHELWQVDDFCKTLSRYQDLDGELFDTILKEAAKFTENVLQPLNQSGDAEGCRFENGNVYTPKGFKEAYRQVVDGGWMALNSNPEYGGQGLPKFLQVQLDEMLCGANVSFSLFTVLTQGAAHAVELHGTDELKQIYLPKLISGEWGGTMCLTEPHCGTDLAMVRTKAEPQKDGSYKITGTKIFISSGEHDLTDNIVHTVLARLPGAPEGIKGISMFLVPKRLPDAQGEAGESNGVNCGSIEHKMGIRGSSTAVINFDHATGYLLSEENKGMRAMFNMMNMERLNIGLQGLGLADVAYQNARNYAQERLQSRALTGPKYPNKPADPIIVHPDVRRMLLTIRAHNEAGRALVAWIAIKADIAKYHDDAKERAKADSLIALLTPVVKAFYTDYGYEACNLALQVLGGHGYIKEWGLEQFVRDARIAQIYEGTNGIQALDLVKRKLVMDKGEALNYLTEIMTEFMAQESHEDELMGELIEDLERAVKTLVDTSYWIMQHSEDDPNIVGCASYDYLHMLGLVCFAFMWAQMAKVAFEKLTHGEDRFYQNKVYTAKFFFKRVLPKVYSLKQTIQSESAVLMAMPDEAF